MRSWMYKMIKAIIFDMGGVVLNAKIENAYEILANKLNVTKEKFDIAKNKYIKDAQRGKITTEELLNKISLELNIDKNKLKKYWEEAYSEVMIINKDVIKVVDLLKKKGYITALITNTIGIHSSLNKKRGVYDRFAPTLLSNEIGIIKPEEGIYKKMLESLRLKPAECVFIDDREEHLVPAVNLGINSILYKNNKQLIEDLRKLGVEI